MGKVPTTPRQRLAKNLKALIDLQDLTVYRVAEDAKVDPKTVYNMLKGSFDPRLSIVEKLANVFGLTTWQILAVDRGWTQGDHAGSGDRLSEALRIGCRGFGREGCSGTPVRRDSTFLRPFAASPSRRMGYAVPLSHTRDMWRPHPTAAT
jgi:transcriptional regulator with XRE-family HTH domain